MVLQRWQTVFLFLAALAMAIFTFMPVMRLVADNGNMTLSALGCGEGGVTSYLLLILDVLVVIMSVVAIFKYRNLKLQHRLCKVNLLLIVSLLIAIALMWIMQRGVAYAFITPWIALPFIAMFFTIWAGSRIKADRKLLSDSEHLR